MNTGNPKLGIIEPLTTSTGKKIWIRTDKIPYYDGDDKIIGVIVFSTEITEQVNLPFVPKGEPQKVSGVFFTSFVVQ